MPYRRVLRLVFVALVALTVLILDPPPCAAKFNPASFESDKTNIVLGIDLRDETNIEMGLVVRDSDSRTPEMTRIFLPFATVKAAGSDQVVSAWGSYNGLTYLSFVLPGNGSTYYSIELVPVVRRASGAADARTIPDPITVIESGQERTFIYRYLSENPADSGASKFFRSGALPVDAVAVALPEDARALEVKDGKTSDPEAYFYKDRIGFFPAVQQGSVKMLELRYWLPATEGQKAVQELLTKLFALIGAPLATIIVTKVSGRSAGRRRYWVIVGGVAVQIVVFVLITTFWFKWAGATSVSNLIDIVIGVLGIGISIIVWWISD
jgi:hypothetical protein